MTSKLIRYSLYLVASLFIVSYFIPYTIIDPALENYDREYKALLIKYCPKDKYIHPLQKTMYFQDLPIGNIAYCQTNSYTSFKIVYNKREWDIQSEEQRFSTARHELSHCYFGIGHSDDPKNYMYPYERFLSRQVVEQQTIELIQEQCK